MTDPKVNGGISGHLKYRPEIIEELEKEIERLNSKYPVCDIRIQLSDITDKRWNNYKCKENKVF